MKRTLLDIVPDTFPEKVVKFVGNAKIYDSSCSPEARVYFVDKDAGYYIKTSAAGTLEREALMTAYFHKKGIGARAIEYLPLASDWLISERVAGEDCTHARYLDDPKRLCDTLACELRRLHELDASDCPVKDRMGEYLALAEKNYRTDNYDKSQFPDSFGYRSPEEALAVLEAGKGELKNEVLIHGDYCLPNVMLDDWLLSGFIDVGNAGIGDRHVDIFWATWTLWFNLKTNDYRDRFLDAYGRELIDTDKLKTVAAAEVFG